MDNPNIHQLAESKIYVKNDTSYPSPKRIIDPWLNNLNYMDEPLNIAIQNPVINQNPDTREDNIAYPRFMVEMKKREVVFGEVEYQSTFGLLVALDQQSPVVKVYTGMNVSACLNMCIFNASHFDSQNATDDLTNIWTRVKQYAEEEEEKVDEYRKYHEKLTETILNPVQQNETIGILLKAAKTTHKKLGTGPIVQATGFLTDKNSIYYADGDTSLYNIYNAVTQSITNGSDLLYRPDKTLSLTSILLN